MTNTDDGTLYCSDSIRELMDAEFATGDFPYLSHILGADWGSNFGSAFPRSPEDYRQSAKIMAARIYPDPTGHFIDWS